MTAPHMDDFDLSGLQSPSMTRGWPEAAKLAVAGGAGCGLIVLVECVAIYFAVQAMFSARVPDGLEVRIKAPPKAIQGKAVPLSLVVRNEGEQPFTVRGLLVRSTTLRGFTLEQFKPAPTVPKTSLFGTDTWVYSQAVAPGKSWTLQLQATPQRIGKVSGALEVQVDRGIRQASFTVDVTPATGATKPAKTPAGK